MKLDIVKKIGVEGQCPVGDLHDVCEVGDDGCLVIPGIFHVSRRSVSNILASLSLCATPLGARCRVDIMGEICWFGIWEQRTIF